VSREVAGWPLRGEVWLASLDPTVGREIRKRRPALVISPDEMNAVLRTVTVIPMTTGSRPTPFRIPITFDGKQGLVVLDQLRTVDRQRLVRLLGVADGTVVDASLAALQEMFSG
jgi:mRNA interferase MazF